MNTLIMMRHGQSLWNLNDLFTGWVDVPLSPLGIEEALKGGMEISHIPIDRVYTSVLNRAIMTAFLALSKHQSKKTPVLMHPSSSKLHEWGQIHSEKTLNEIIPVTQSWHLNERMYGQLQGMNKEEMRKLYGKPQVEIWRRSYDVAPPGGESLKMTAERTLPYFNKEILPKLEKGETIFISAHGNSMRSIIMELDNLSEKEVVSLEIPTGKPILYSFDNGKLKRV